MNKNTIRGAIDKAAGKAKQKVGFAFGDDEQIEEGKKQVMKGEVESGLGEAQDKVQSAADKVKDAMEPENIKRSLDNTAENIRTGFQNVGDKIKSGVAAASASIAQVTNASEEEE